MFGHSLEYRVYENRKGKSIFIPFLITILKKCCLFFFLLFTELKEVD